MRPGGARAVVAAAAALSLAVPALLWRAVDAARGRAAVALSSALGDQVSLGGAEVGLTGTLTLSDVRLGDLVDAETVEAAIGPASLLAGNFAADEITVERPRVRARLEHGSLDLARLLARLRPRRAPPEPSGAGAGRRLRRIVIRDGEIVVDLADRGSVRARDVEILPTEAGVRVVLGPAVAELRLGAWSAHAELGRAGLDVELPEPRLGRVALDGGQVTIGAAGQPPLAITNVVVVRGKETRFTGTLPGGGALAITLGDSAIIEADGLPLAPLAPALPSWLPAAGSASGTVRVELDGTTVALSADVRGRGLSIDHPLLSRTPLPLSGALQAKLRWDRVARTGAGTLRLSTGDVTVDADVELALGEGDTVRRAALDARLATVSCAEALAALPAPLRAPLDGLDLTGTIGGRAEVAFDRDRPDEARLATDLDVGCAVVRDESAAPVALLTGPYAHRLPGGGERVLAASDPDFVPLHGLAPWIAGAFVAAEDARFFDHHGFDAEQLRRSFTIDVAAGKIERGGSTISQQLVKNLFLGRERTLGRKLAEAIITWRLEQQVPKARILEAYLNVIELGDGIYGLGPGARRWFNKPAAQLGPAEAAVLAAITSAPATAEERLRATGRLDPQILHRAEAILAGMRRKSMVHGDDYQRALRSLSTLRPATI